MQKILNILSIVIKFVTTGLGVLTTTDASVLNLSTGTLGGIVGALGTAALAVKALQIKVSPPTFNQ